MNKTTDYCIVGTTADVSVLQDLVMDAIKAGRQPLGGISVVVREGDYNNDYCYMQSMVKYDLISK